MKKLLVIGFILSGLLLPACLISVIATLAGISPRILLSNGEVLHEEPTDLSFLITLAYPLVWGLALIFARRALQEPVRKARLIIWTLAPFLWIIVPAVCIGITRHATHPEWQRKNEKIGRLQDYLSTRAPAASEREAAFQTLVGFTQDPDRSVRHYAIGALGRAADGLSGLEKKEAVSVLIDRLSDPWPDARVTSTMALGRFGADAEPAIEALLKVASGSNEVEAEFSIMTLAQIARAKPFLVVPTLVKIVQDAHEHGKGIYQATFAARILRQFPDESADIIPAISKCSALPASHKVFYTSEFLEAWLLTMTTLDPKADHYDQAILEGPIITLLKEPNVYRKDNVLRIVVRLKAPTSLELAAVADVAQHGGTAQIRTQAQKVLDEVAKQTTK